MEIVVVVNKYIFNATEGKGVMMMRDKYVIMPGREGRGYHQKQGVRRGSMSAAPLTSCT